jgi:hypothetical protein
MDDFTYIEPSGTTAAATGAFRASGSTAPASTGLGLNTTKDSSSSARPDLPPQLL